MVLVLVQGKPRDGQYQASVGVCMNFNKLHGMEFMSSAEECRDEYDQPMLAKVFDAMDFIGISNYPQVGRMLQVLPAPVVIVHACEMLLGAVCALILPAVPTS